MALVGRVLSVQEVTPTTTRLPLWTLLRVTWLLLESIADCTYAGVEVLTLPAPLVFSMVATTLPFAKMCLRVVYAAKALGKKVQVIQSGCS